MTTNSNMRVLVACEFSGTVRQAFRETGADAWSCDLLPSDDGSQYHIQSDCIEVIGGGEWDMVIAHPPCTHLAVSGARHFEAKRKDGRQSEAVGFFLDVVRACDRHAAHWAIENPIGIMSQIYRKPDQIIQPWQFGHGEVKATCFWLSNLPKLTPTDIVPGRTPRIWKLPPSPDRWKQRSVTYSGVARAMASQWRHPDFLQLSLIHSDLPQG